MATLQILSNDEPIIAKKPPVDPATLEHAALQRGPFWQKIPAYKDVSEATFLDHALAGEELDHQGRQAPRDARRRWCSPAFIEDLERGMKRAPMSVRVSPVPRLADRLGATPTTIPLRIQFFPLASRLLPDHPKLGLDSLHEQADAPVPGLTHRYRDKALFLPLDTCPVYCRFCTRSYAIGLDTEEVEKVHLKAERGALAARVPLHRLAPRARGHRHLRRRRLPAPRRSRSRTSATTLLGDAQHPPHALRHQGPGGDAAEDPDRRRVGRRADPRRRAGAQAAQGGRAPHPLQPPERDHRHHRGGDEPALRARASSCATSRCSSAA